MDIDIPKNLSRQRENVQREEARKREEERWQMDSEEMSRRAELAEVPKPPEKRAETLPGGFSYPKGPPLALAREQRHQNQNL